MRAHAVAGALALTLTGCAPNVPDVAVASHDDFVVAGPSSASSSDGYEYVAKRPLGIVALAESREIPQPLARAAIDRIADALDVCVGERATAVALPRGAARVVVRIDGDGAVTATNVRVDPGAGALPVALACLVSPAKLLMFSASDAGARGMAIEAVWGPPEAVNGRHPAP